MFICEERHIMFATLTFAFIYFPSLNAIASLYGPRSAGISSFFWGCCMCTFWWIFSILHSFNQYNISSESNLSKLIFFNLLFFIGAVKIVLGILMIQSRHCCSRSSWTNLAIGLIPRLLFYPFIFILAPFITIVVKLISVFKPCNKLIKSQSRICGRGEAILEATPQFLLQLYIVISVNDLASTPRQTLVMITSAITLCIPNLEKYMVTRGLEFGFNILKGPLWIFVLASIFKTLALALSLVIFYFIGTIWMLAVNWFCLLLSIAIIFSAVSNVILLARKNPCKRMKQIGECFLLSWFTLTNMESGQTAAILRLVSTIHHTVFFSILLFMSREIVMLYEYYKETNPLHKLDPLYNYLENLRLLKNSEELNLLVTLTIGLGWLTLVLDIIIASCKSIDWRSYNWGPLTPAIEWFVDPVDDNLDFFGRSVFLEGLKYLCCFR